MQPLFQPVEPQEHHIKLEDILPWRADNEHGPKNSLEQSLEVFGANHSAITVLDKGKGKFEVFDGRRRLDAYKAKGLTEIRALVYPQGTDRGYLAGIALTNHLSRDRNPLDEASNIQSLLAKGLTLETISKQLKQPISTLRKLVNIAHLPKSISQAVREKRLTLESAEIYTKLDPEAQADIELRLAEGESLKASEIKEYKRTQNQEVFAEALFQMDFAPPTPEEIFRQNVFQALENGIKAKDLIAIVHECEGASYANAAD